jgi:hypothetical protein
MSSLRGCFPRTETWQHAGRHVSAPVGEMPKRNGQTIARQAHLLRFRLVVARTPNPALRRSDHAGKTQKI